MPRRLVPVEGGGKFLGRHRGSEPVADRAPLRPRRGQERPQLVPRCVAAGTGPQPQMPPGEADHRPPVGGDMDAAGKFLRRLEDQRGGVDLARVGLAVDDDAEPAPGPGHSITPPRVPGRLAPRLGDVAEVRHGVGIAAPEHPLADQRRDIRAADRHQVLPMPAGTDRRQRLGRRGVFGDGDLDVVGGLEAGDQLRAGVALPVDRDAARPRPGPSPARRAGPAPARLPPVAKTRSASRLSSARSRPSLTRIRRSCKGVPLASGNPESGPSRLDARPIIARQAERYFRLRAWRPRGP